MANIITLTVLLIILSIASMVIWKQKKNGKRCFGCSGADCSSCHCKK